MLGFKPKVLSDEYNLSDYPVDILSFDNNFLECNIAQGMIFKSKRSGIFHNWTMTVDPGYKYIERFYGGISWYMMESKVIISSICFKLKNENGNLVSFNGQSVTFRLSIKEIWILAIICVIILGYTYNYNTRTYTIIWVFILSYTYNYMCILYILI